MDTFVQFRADAAFKRKLMTAAKKYAKKRGRPERGALSDFLRDAALEKMERDAL